MKKETLAKRIAQKAGCPELGPYILGLTEKETLPTHCLPWQGMREGLVIRPRMVRVGFELRMRTPAQVSRIRFQGQKHQVNRLIKILRDNPQEKFRMRKICPTPFCVNPLHWEMVVTTTVLTQEEPTMDLDEWTSQDVEEMLEILFTEHNPKTWDEVINAPLMHGAPPALIVPILKRWHKTHLCPN